MIYTDEFIRELLSCEKMITKPPTKEYKTERQQDKKDFSVDSKEGKYKFKVFIRKNINFEENFSIGLLYNPQNGEEVVCLLRFNGRHGGNRAAQHHFEYHIHSGTAKIINDGLKSDSNIDITTDYASLDDAIQIFLSRINLDLIDKQRYFPSNQINLL
jgi:hypothetical protein